MGLLHHRRGAVVGRGAFSGSRIRTTGPDLERRGQLGGAAFGSGASTIVGATRGAGGSGVDGSTSVGAICGARAGGSGGSTAVGATPGISRSAAETATEYSGPSGIRL